MHDNGVVHADLKPPNIMWSAQVSGFKLIDFGVSFTTKEKFTHAVQSKGGQNDGVIVIVKLCWCIILLMIISDVCFVSADLHQYFLSGMYIF